MPGVLMLEAMYQAGMWLIYATEDFKHSTIALKQANQVKFYGFLQPGSQLVVVLQWKKQEGDEISMVATGEIDGKLALKAKIVFERFNLVDRDMAAVANDEYVQRFRKDEMLRLLDPMGSIRREICLETSTS